MTRTVRRVRWREPSGRVAFGYGVFELDAGVPSHVFSFVSTADAGEAHYLAVRVASGHTVNDRTHEPLRCIDPPEPALAPLHLVDGDDVPTRPQTRSSMTMRAVRPDDGEGPPGAA